MEIVKRPGQTLGLYIREGNGADRQEGVFISRIALESPVYNSGCLRVGDEVLAVNLVDVTRMSLDDVVIIMSIPRRLLLTTRSRRGVRQPQHQTNRHEPKPPPVVVLKKDYEEEPLDDSTSNGDQLRMGALGRSMQAHGMPPPQERFSTLPRYRPPDMSSLRHEEPLMYYNRGGPQGPPPLPPHYGIKPGPSPVPSMGGMGPPHATHPGYIGRGGRLPGPGGSRGGYGMPPGPDHLYQPPPPVITEQPRQRMHPNFYQYDRSYPKTLESLAERIHSFYGPPRPPGPQSMEPDIGYGGTLGRSTAGRPRLARTLSDQRLPATEREALSDYEGSSGVSAARRYKAWQQASLAPLQQAYISGEGATLDRYQEAMRRLSALRQRTRSVDYASDTEVLAPRPLAARPRSASSRSNSLPRQRHHRAGGAIGIDPLSLRPTSNMGRGVRSSLGPGMRLGGTGRHSLAGSEDESDGAVSAPEMPIGPRHERGKRRSSATTTTATTTTTTSTTTSASFSAECSYDSYSLNTMTTITNDDILNKATDGTGNMSEDGYCYNYYSPIGIQTPSVPVFSVQHMENDEGRVQMSSYSTSLPEPSATFSSSSENLATNLQNEQDTRQLQIGIHQELFQQQTDLEYHLQQKRFLKEKLKQQKKQILLEKHIQQQQLERDNVKNEYVMPEDFLTQQLDQHIQFHQKQQPRDDNVNLFESHRTNIVSYAQNPNIDFLTEQLDQHISQQHHQQERIQQKHSKQIRRHEKLHQEVDISQYSNYNDSSESDVNTSSTTEDEITPKISFEDNMFQRTPGEGRDDQEPQRLQGNHQEVELNVDEDTPLILQQHTLPQTRQKHKRSKSDVDILPEQQIQLQNQTLFQRMSLVPIPSLQQSVKYDTYARIPMNDPSNPCIILAESSNIGTYLSPYAQSLVLAGKNSLDQNSFSTPHVVLHSPHEQSFSSGMRKGAPNEKEIYSPSIQNDASRSVVNNQIYPENFVAPTFNTGNGNLKNNHTSSPCTYYSIPGSASTTGVGDDGNSYSTTGYNIDEDLYQTGKSLTSLTLPRNLPSRSVTFAPSPQYETRSLFPPQGNDDATVKTEPVNTMRNDSILRRGSTDSVKSSFIPYSHTDMNRIVDGNNTNDRVPDYGQGNNQTINSDYFEYPTGPKLNNAIRQNNGSQNSLPPSLAGDDSGNTPSPAAVVTSASSMNSSVVNDVVTLYNQSGSSHNTN